MYGIYANIWGILMGSMLPYIAYMDPMGYGESPVPVAKSTNEMAMWAISKRSPHGSTILIDPHRHSGTGLQFLPSGKMQRLKETVVETIAMEMAHF